jgi:hypothetical protein
MTTTSTTSPRSRANSSAQAALGTAKRGYEIGRQVVSRTSEDTRKALFPWKTDVFKNAPVWAKWTLGVGALSMNIYLGSLGFGFLTNGELPKPRNFLEAINPSWYFFEAGSRSRDWFDKETKRVETNTLEWNEKFGESE